MTARLRIATIAFWVLFGLISGVQIQISMLAHHHSWPLVLGYQVVVWSVWIAYSFAIGALLRRVPLIPARAPAILFHLATAVALALVHVAIWVGVELWLQPYDFMNPPDFALRFRSVTQFQTPFEIVLYGLVALAHHAAAVAARERERERQAAHLEKSLAEARLHALKLQIQPHFLFNTLNGISSLVRGGQNAQAIAMMGGLSDLLRYSLGHGPEARVPLADEVAMIERYFDIQRLRFADRLNVELDVPADALRAEVPVFLLQPLAENAVQHGIAASNASGRVTLRARRDGEVLTIEVFNTGRLADRRRDGIGLAVTASRLAQMYGERGRFELAEHDGGVVARVEVPWSTPS